MNKFDLYYQVAHSHLVEQDTRNQQIEFKASGAIALSAALMGLAALTIDHWASWSIVPFCLVLIGFAVAAGSSIRILWAKTFDRRPDLPYLFKHLGVEGIGDDGLTLWTAEEFTKSVEINDPVLDGKADRLQRVLVGLIVEASSLGVLILSTNLQMVVQFIPFGD